MLPFPFKPWALSHTILSKNDGRLKSNDCDSLTCTCYSWDKWQEGQKQMIQRFFAKRKTQNCPNKEYRKILLKMKNGNIQKPINSNITIFSMGNLHKSGKTKNILSKKLSGSQRRSNENLKNTKSIFF